ncbi:hypothetical protein EYF80_005459 [Liparis tanakae]|uniref:Uncharacterized protein n=1 Tax=Liparis tanakae TaxID=230148 RepID=A0A4Z2J3U8_9TELE|nr:hypothetical protein EYF80_005459 [Liparis tanakae]
MAGVVANSDNAAINDTTPPQEKLPVHRRQQPARGTKACAAEQPGDGELSVFLCHKMAVIRIQGSRRLSVDIAGASAESRKRPSATPPLKRWVYGRPSVQRLVGVALKARPSEQRRLFKSAQRSATAASALSPDCSQGSESRRVENKIPSQTPPGNGALSNARFPELRMDDVPVCQVPEEIKAG